MIDLTMIQTRIASMSARTRKLIEWSDSVGAEAARVHKTVKIFLAKNNPEERTDDNGKTADNGILRSGRTNPHNSSGVVAL